MNKNKPYRVIISLLIVFISPFVHADETLIKEKETPIINNEKKVFNPLGESISIKLIDHEMLNAKRERVQLVKDVMGDKLVIMNFIYTDCKTVCPVSTHIMSEVYKKIQANEDNKTKVKLITLTLNPKVDTPKKMQEFSEKYAKSGSEWAWLTGSSTKVNEALLGLRAYAPVVSEHSSVILVGDPKDNHWTGFYQFPKPDNIVERVYEYIEKRQAK